MSDGELPVLYKEWAAQMGLEPQNDVRQTTLSKNLPQKWAKRLLWLPPAARSMGIHIMAGKGSGKSRLMGRIITWLDFLEGVPQVVLDPVGGTIDNFLDKLVRLPEYYQRRLWPRVIYVDMSGRSGSVVPMPLYYRLGNESLSEIAGRYLQAVRRIDPYLQTASIEGWNPLWRIGIYTGMVLAALNCQISEAESLLNHPEAWIRRIERAARHFPELAPAAAFFAGEYDSWEPNRRDRQTSSFRNKVTLFSLDPAMKAMFGAAKPGIDWKEAEERRYTVLLDFRHEYELERRRFKMYWAFSHFLEYIKHRGPGRNRGFGFTIDEIAPLMNLESMGNSLFASDLDEFINVIARNYMVWPTIAHQEMWQVDQRSQKTLMTMGTQILGVTSDPESAVVQARQFFRYDPYQLKKIERVWMSDPIGGPFVVDSRTVEFTPEEQTTMDSQKLMDLGRFQFLVRPAPGEGDVTGRLVAVSIDHFDQGLYPNEDLVTRARELLTKRCGRPVAEVLAEIDLRTKPPQLLISSPKSPTTKQAAADERDDFYGP